jgi:TolB-like protein/Tfp pilus assembly protein PilF
MDTYEFGPFRLEPWPARLVRGGEVVPLTPKALETLRVLVRNQGRLVSKRQLMENVWPGVHVEEVGLARNISVIRRALGTPARRVAVLPFKEMGDRQEGYLGLGIADALIARLSLLCSIVVRPTNAVRQYRSPGLDPIAAGRSLQVDWVVDGCLQASGDRLRVTAQVVRVEDGATVLAEKYDRRSTDLFGLEDTIADDLADILAIRLTPEDRLLLARRGTANNDAHLHYLKGRYHWNRRTDEGMRRAIACFNEAIAADPTYALAYAGLADAYTLLGAIAYGAFRPEDVWPRARAAALRALALDDRLAEARASLGFIKFRYDWDWEEAERDLAAAIGMNPHYATARQWHAYLLSTRGHHDAALSEIRCAQELDPLSLPIATGIGRLLCFAGRYEDAVVECRKAVEMDGTFAGAHLDLGLACEQLRAYEEAISEFQRAVELSGGSHIALVHLGHAYGISGQHDKAREVLHRLRRHALESYVAPSDWAVYHIGVGNTAEALTCLEKGYEGRDSFMVLLKVEPILAPLRDEPRFLDLLRRMERPHPVQPG